MYLPKELFICDVSLKAQFILDLHRQVSGTELIEKLYLIWYTRRHLMVLVVGLIKLIMILLPVADLHAKLSGATYRPPNQTQIFRFYIRFCRKTPASEVGTCPSNEGWHSPPSPHRETVGPRLHNEYLAQAIITIQGRTCLAIHRYLLPLKLIRCHSLVRRIHPNHS